MELDVKLGIVLVDMYVKCGCIEMASRVFEDMVYRDVFVFIFWIFGLLNYGLGRRAIELFNRM